MTRMSGVRGMAQSTIPDGRICFMDNDGLLGSLGHLTATSKLKMQPFWCKLVLQGSLNSSQKRNKFHGNPNSQRPHREGLLNSLTAHGSKRLSSKSSNLKV